MVLKRLEDAEADCDPIFGVILGTNTNHCGQTDSITRPHEGDQVSVFKRIVRHSGIDPMDVSYIEMHGTGTQAGKQNSWSLGLCRLFLNSCTGDATEMNSVLSVFVPEYKRTQMLPARPLYLGSAKANIGHAESASGVSSLIKVLMMMKHGEIPPHCGIKNRINHNYPLDLAQRGVNIALETTPWRRQDIPSGKRSVFLNNFSAAGGNTALLVEDAPIRMAEEGTEDPRTIHVITLSAKSPKSLVGNINTLITFLGQAGSWVSLPALSYTTTARRMHHSFRAAVSGSDLASVLSALRACAAGKEASITDLKPIPASVKKQPRVVAMFSGQGTLYTEMGKLLFYADDFFRKTVLELDRLSLIQGFPSFIGLVDGRISTEELPDISAVVAQLALVGVQIALFELWKSWGVMPAAVIGHSLGEYSALYAAGVLSTADVLYLVGARASLLERVCSRGTHCMLAVKATQEVVDDLIRQSPGCKDCKIACANQPSGHVVSGPVDQVNSIVRQAEKVGIEAVRLKVPFAFHSAQVDPILDEFQRVASEGVVYNPPRIPVLSPLTGKVVPAHQTNTLNSDYLTRACREPVRFSNALASVAEILDPANVIWLDIGSHPVCTGMVKGTMGPHVRTIATIRQNVDPYKTLVAGLETLYLAGIDINWNEYHRGFPAAHTVLDLPMYSWDLKNYWIQYRNDFLLTKGEGVAHIASPTPPPRKYLSPCAQSVVEETHGTEKSSITVESDVFDPKLLPVLQGHLVNGAALAPSVCPRHYSP